MLFIELTTEKLSDQILKMNAYTLAPKKSVFLHIFPSQSQRLALEEKYKPEENEMGLYSQYTEEMQLDDELMSKLEERITESGYKGSNYSHSDASLKLHISINNIVTIDAKVVIGLIQLLIAENSASDNLQYKFKIIQPPACARNNRFKMNDQITIYLDKYSSSGELVRLSETIHQYLLRNKIKENTTVFGQNDCFGFNSFVSARFDTNKLLNQYNVYPFFDLELQKFFQQHQAEELDLIPLCAFEIVFNKLLISDKIQIPHKDKGQSALSEKDSLYVQQELKMLLEDPLNYLQDPKSDFVSDKVKNDNPIDEITDPARPSLNVTANFENPALFFNRGSSVQEDENSDLSNTLTL